MKHVMEQKTVYHPAKKGQETSTMDKQLLIAIKMKRIQSRKEKWEKVNY